MPTALLIIAQDGYQDHEYEGTRAGLEEAGVTVSVASAQAGECKGKLGGRVMADIAMKDVDLSVFDRVAFIGGPGAAVYAKHPDALRIAHEAVGRTMPLGAICIAPTILAAAGVLRWKKATVWNEDGKQRDVLEDAGATFVDEPVVIDGLIVTANGPEAATEFGKAVAKL
jgi:protease I